MPQSHQDPACPQIAASSLTLIDWAPHAPDANMGLFGPVRFSQGSDPVRLTYPSVSTRLLGAVAAGECAPPHALELAFSVTVSNLGAEALPAGTAPR